MTVPQFIDFEASSLDLVVSYPIEVGVCTSDGSVQAFLIKPHVLWKDWSLEAEQVHGISRTMLEEQGKEISYVTRQLNQLISGTIYCDAFTFDSFWLHRLFKTAKVKPEFEIDSVSSLLEPEEVSLWQTRHNEQIAALGLQMHRAANDAKVLRETYLSLKNR